MVTEDPAVPVSPLCFQRLLCSKTTIHRVVNRPFKSTVHQSCGKPSIYAPDIGRDDTVTMAAEAPAVPASLRMPLQIAYRRVPWIIHMGYSRNAGVSRCVVAHRDDCLGSPRRACEAARGGHRVERRFREVRDGREIMCSQRLLCSKPVINRAVTRPCKSTIRQSCSQSSIYRYSTVHLREIGRDGTVTMASEASAVPVRPRVVDTALKVASERKGEARISIVNTCGTLGGVMNIRGGGVKMPLHVVGVRNK